MAFSGLGGQAVIEGIMMKYKDDFAVAIRKEDGDIITLKEKYKSIFKEKYKKMPFIRGVLNLIDSFSIGMKALNFSAYDEEEVNSSTSKIVNILITLLSVLIALTLFLITPYIISLVFKKIIASDIVITIIEGVVRLMIFLLYIITISLMPDIKRLFMYHGAEHKCINCIENLQEFNVSNIKKCSRIHKRCGTSFIIYVILFGVIIGMFINTPNLILRLVIRILILPVIASISYEFIFLSTRYDNALVKVITSPGLLIQRLTTKEPTEDMILVGQRSILEVFDIDKFYDEQKIQN